jgi:hypothetical protein
LFGNGDGTFQTPITTLLNFSLPTVVVSAHFNGDGKVDVATAFSDTRIVDVSLSNGDGTLAHTKAISQTADWRWSSANST